MTTPSPGHRRRLTPAQRAEIDDRIEAFWQASQRGEGPRIADHLPADLEIRKAVLLGLVRIDMEARIKAGKPARVESYQQSFPELAQDAHLIVGSTSYPGHGLDETAPLQPASSGRSSEKLPVPELTGQFGRYRILKTLGSGTMGTVYLAEDSQLGRRVAIKTPSFTGTGSGDLLERFYREARAAATLRHPNICPVYDVGLVDGKHFISMAFIEGRTLADYVRPDKPQPERRILAVIRKLALALEMAHSHGIVHRDLKPSNIMIDASGEPIIMDFGLAQQVQGNQEIRLTRDGDLVGTPAYMSPEQIEADQAKIGPACDQYSLGVILYELLAGQLPFGGSLLNVLSQIATKTPKRPSEIRPNLDARIEDVCLKMMAKRPGDRFASMKAVADELGAILRGRRKDARASSQSSRVPEATSAPPAPVPSVSDREVDSLTVRAKKCLAARDYERAIRFLETIPESARTEEVRRLLSKSIERSDDVAFLLVEIDEALRLDDPRTALAKVDKLEKLKPGHPRIGEIRKQFGNIPRPVVPQWRRQIEPSGFFRTTTTLPVRQTTSERVWKEFVKFFVKTKATTDKAISTDILKNRTVLVVGLAVAVLILMGIAEKVYRTWSHSLAVQNEFLDDNSTAFSRDGRWFVGRSADGTIKIWETESGREPLTLSELGPLTILAFSPDGQRLVNSSRSEAGYSLTVRDASSGSEVVTLGQAGVRIWCAAFSPDAARIASGDESGDVNVWDSRDGNRLQTFNKAKSAVVGGIAYSPEGERLVTGHRDGTVRVWDSVTGSMLSTLKGHKGAVTCVAVSAGAKLVASGGEDNTIKVWDLSKGQAIWTLKGHTDHVASVAFSPDGKGIASGSDDKTLRVWNAATGLQRLKLTGYTSRVSSVAFSPDGKRVLSGGGGNERFSSYRLSDSDNL